MSLPSPSRERWQPLRCGLLNLYKYDDEELHFDQGRLLLRGNNGSGKSRVLALQLPFLLDGDTRPHRLEPDADPAKRVEWNLLMGRHEERRGYTWIEFGRRDEDGTEHFLTLGCGLHAIEGKGLAGRWFFVTSKRVGRDLSLQSGGAALSRDRLTEKLGAEGQVLTSASDYRALVDQRLFKLGDRYEALIDLLIQLRQPQLSRHLDEGKLSKALSSALPPVPAAVVADLAESFRSLEADRAALEGFVGARDASEAFLAEYRRYARVAARRRAEGVRSAHAAYEGAMRELRAAEAGLEQATAARAEAEARLATAERDVRGGSAEVETLRRRPEMEQAQSLEAARRAAAQRGADAGEAARERGYAEEQRARRERELAAAEAEAGRDREEVERALTAAQGAAASVGLGTELLPDGWEAAPGRALQGAQRRVEQEVAERLRKVGHLRGLEGEATRARSARERAEAALEGAGGELERAREREQEAAGARQAAAEALVAAWQAWAAGLSELGIPEADPVAEALAVWCEAGEGESPAAVATQRALREALEALAGARAGANQAIQGAVDRRRALEQERDLLLRGGHQPPPPSRTRAPESREGRPGAPLWQLCEFAPGLDAVARAGLEAALEASGLLDAWVTPDGRVLAEGVLDAALSATEPAPLPREQQLGRWMVPSELEVFVHDGGSRGEPRSAPNPPKPPVPPKVVRAVLARIGAGRGAGQVWVDPSGQFALGPLRGAWGKAEAEHVGHASREAARRRRLAELEVELGAAAEALAVAEAARAEVDRRERVAGKEAASAPGEGDVRRALADQEAAVRAVFRARAAFVEREQEVGDHQRAEAQALAARDRAAADLGLSAWVDALDRHDAALAELSRAAAALWPTARAAAAAAGRARGAAEEAGVATARALDRAAAHEEALSRLREAEVHRDTLERTHGAAVEEILRQLDQAEARLKVLQKEQREAQGRHTSAFAGEQVAARMIESGREKLEGATRAREAQISALAALEKARLLPVIDLPGEGGAGWPPTRAVDVARRIEATHGDVEHDDRTWDRLQKGIFRHVEALRDALLPHRYEPQTSSEDGLIVVTVPYQDRDATMQELRGLLVEEVTHRGMVLDAREREVLENHLIGEVASHLHDLLHRCEGMVRDMNRELAARPTSTGMKLRFSWAPDVEGPLGLAEARQRLLRTGGTWSPADRELLARFLKDQIDAVRGRSEGGTWQEHLTAALDYRAWHTFAVERWQDGTWRRLTRRTHGTGSGGEKALALTIPQFAAAAAHYRSADPRAPRLILLDEAFVGIDSDMRAKCMGLLSAFDLDFVMTSEREWGCYATLPGLAICQLMVRPDIDAVGVTRWIWNGRERVRADLDVPRDGAPVPQLGGA